MAGHTVGLLVDEVEIGDILSGHGYIVAVLRIEPNPVWLQDLAYGVGTVLQAADLPVAGGVGGGIPGCAVGGCHYDGPALQTLSLFIYIEAIQAAGERVGEVDRAAVDAVIEGDLNCRGSDCLVVALKDLADIVISRLKVADLPEAIAVSLG